MSYLIWTEATTRHATDGPRERRCDDAYHKFYHFLSAFGSTFEKGGLEAQSKSPSLGRVRAIAQGRERDVAGRRLLNKRGSQRRLAPAKKIVREPVEEEGPRSSDGMHSFPRDVRTPR